MLPGMVRVLHALLPVLVLCEVSQSFPSLRHYPVFLRNDTQFEHLALHPEPGLGRVYVGARDRLFRLSSDLQLEEEVETGPVTDSHDCLPPISDTSCPQARPTSNHNKLLLIDPYSKVLISCGSVHQGTCQKRDLDAVGTVLFSAQRPVDTQYVAANEPEVSTVGLVVRPHRERQPVLYVGRGYTSSQPPISTRNLATEPIFSYEETAKLTVVARLSEYDHHFVASFAHNSHVYFLFYRRDLKSEVRDYRTYVSRVCLDDMAYYSYVEVPLSCRSAAGKNYNLLQAARLGLPRAGETRGVDEEILLGVFSTRYASSSKPSNESALCMFSLQELDKRINDTRDLCYTKVGRQEGQEAAYIEYEVKSNCASLPPTTLEAYPCGSDHTPSPMASRVAVEAEPILDSPSARLTAVAISVKADHTIAFLGDSKGNLHKVFLGPRGEVEEYAIIPIQSNTAISSELTLDQSEEHLYIMTSTMLQKRPVAECHLHLDCQSCLSARDPYCGWCVLEGRCGRRGECARGEQADQWLWSFDMEPQCLTVQTITPSNISREESRTITLSIPGLPRLEDGKSYSCFFQDIPSPATITESGVTCPSPDPHRVPSVSPGQDFLTVTLSLRFGDVIVTSREFNFYDCRVVKQLSGSMPCHGCVSSRWGCNWCVREHVCTHKSQCEQGVIIYNENFKVPTPSPPPSTPVKITTVSLKHALHTTTPPTKPPTTTTVPTTTTTATTPTTQATTTTTPVATTTIAPATTSTPTTLSTVPEPTIAPTIPMLPTPPSQITTTTPSASTLPVLKERTSEEILLASETEGEALSEAKSVVITISSLDTGMKTEPPLINSAAKDQQLPSVSPSQGGVLLFPEEVTPLVEPVTNAPELPSSPQIVEELPPLAEPPTETLNITQSESPETVVADSKPDVLYLLPTVPAVLPSDLPVHSENEADETETEVLHLPLEEMGMAENDTTAFSAATVLSGDGELDHASPGYPHLLDVDSETDYHYDMADLPQGDEGLFENWGSSACPCVEKVQGSPLLPVQTVRKINLLARNLHLYEDQDLEYECVLVIEGRTVVVVAYVEQDDMNPSLFDITCQHHQYSYSALVEEYNAMVYVKRRDTFHVDSANDLFVTLYNCSVGRSDCSRCHTADQKYDCVWCGEVHSSCVHKEACSTGVKDKCPAPVIHFIEPLTGLREGGTTLTISGSNLGQKAHDILQSVTVAGISCTVIPELYEISSRIVCTTGESREEKSGHVSVAVSGAGHKGLSIQTFSYQEPVLEMVSPQRGPRAGGTSLTIKGKKLLTGRSSDISVLLGDVPCLIVSDVQEGRIECVTGASNQTGGHRVTVRYGNRERYLNGIHFLYTPDPNITQATPTKSFISGGRVISVSGHNLDVVQEPRIRVTMTRKRGSRRRRRRNRGSVTAVGVEHGLLWRHKRIIPEVDGPENTGKYFEERCEVNTSSLLLCRSPGVSSEMLEADMQVEFLLDNLRFDFNAITQSSFTYEPNPILYDLNRHNPNEPYRYKPGSVILVEGQNLDLAIFKEEVVALIGEGICTVKTLTRNHLYCEPPAQQPSPSHSHGRKREGADALPEFTVQMGNLNFSLGRVQYDTLSQSTFPLEAQIGVGAVASLVVLIVVIIVLIYRRKSKQALRDYKKVQIQLENLETSVRDRCKKEFTDLMTEMMDMSSDLVVSGIPFLDYKMYAERIFFPGHRESPLRRDLDVQDCRRATVEQGLVQLSNLLNSKLFLTKFIHTLESQRTFSPRDRAYVASLLTVALHGKLEYFTDILKTLLNDLVEQYVAKNPKLMLRRTETVVEKLLTNWMSICLYSFLRDSAGECLYMLFRAIKHQVDKGPVDAVTGKAKYTLNDSRLLREDLEYHTLTLNVLMQGVGMNETQPVAAKVLDCDTITQVKEKILDQVYKGTSYSHRPHTDSLDLEWRSGVAGHLILSDEDLTSVVQGNWKRLNTLQHYKVPDGATVALVPRHSKHVHHDNHDYVAGEKTPMLEDADEGGVRLWHLVKASEEPELPKHRRGSLRERERPKAIPEIYLTRLLSMKGTLQKFVDDLFTVILSTSRPVPLAVKYFFDLLDDQATHHGISDPETIHIWKTNSLPLRFWINIVKNPQFIFDVQASDNVDAVLSVIAQTFMDSCTIAEHKLGRDSPINKLLYARDIPRYKQMVEKYYADIRQTIPASDQEMNSALAEHSRNYSGELNYLVALHELYKYINKYYDQIITALEEDTTAQKMQLGYRLQQIAAAVENKVTDL
ncbi:plexin-B1 isoform X1 [Pangasianodon hypophthalmus]|uniref:plexin-B1 isoform X1 n=1 Tax=Pangasianodon hypophthalmus TaxID=310915 RepID=UPI000EFF4308|nr:plexin-B1 isoform X1 [Pangasianodon hypophthalmus]XP_026768655.3 plexin-B1 isoform X1 [Pangasianodon hypophthalmus]XP_034167771.2 plexin-B1 isoform X1 [Pangasianodon hypophthalmus]XP_034167780.2 plexin-B1 isoform X1 [Pangasianodon hypophthalmus]